jgi:ribosomal-protein-alanine N-acetyltransferase
MRAMEPFPTLRTERLVLREFAMADAPELHRLAQSREVARMMLHLPHPYEEGMAQEWIATHRPAYVSGERVTWAVTLREEGALVGSITLHLHPLHDNAELGYWIGKPYWKAGMPRKPPRRWCATASKISGYTVSTQTTSGATPPLGRS